MRGQSMACPDKTLSVLRKACALLAAAALTAALAGVLYIMANGLGLSDELDFGAGAYYYADIPAFERFLRSEAYATEIPFAVHLALFLAWGWLMYRLWERMR